MNYFFVFLIQTLLPFSLLLACSWVAYPHANFKKLAWLAILSFIIGSVITLNLPNSQNVKLALAIFSLCILLFAYLSQFIHWQRLNTFWHIMLAILAGSFWAKDPNISMATVYNNLNKLTDEGYLLELTYGDDASRYDFNIEEDFDKDIKKLLIEKAKSFTTLSYYEIEVWVTRATKLAIIEGSEVIKESTIFKFMMQAMRIKDCRDKDGKLYLINY